MPFVRTLLSLMLVLAMALPSLAGNLRTTHISEWGPSRMGMSPGHESLNSSIAHYLPELFRPIASPLSSRAVDLRDVCPPIYSQGQLGSCTAFALGKGAYEIERRAHGLNSPSMSALYLYYWSRAVGGTTQEDSGSDIASAVYALRIRGVATEKRVPYNIKRFKRQPSWGAQQEAKAYRIKDAKRVTDLAQIKAALDKKHPVVGGILLFPSFASFDTMRGGLVSMPDTSKEPLEGAHAVCIVGYDPVTKLFVVRNSWGPFFGDGGYLYLPFDYVTRFGADFWQISL